jgi:anti-anti-sigma regulatory factor
MFEVQFDKSKKLLVIRYAQNVGPEETKRCEVEIKALLAEQPPGFRLLTDLSALESMDVACVGDIRRIMDLLTKKGIEMVVRVIPDASKDIGLNIMSLFHYRRGLQIITCETLEQAMKALPE